MIILGEVHTGLLQHSTALSADTVVAMLSLREGEPVRRSERPGPYAVSPPSLTGVDCRLPSRSGRKVRAVGTVTTRTVVSGGRIVQGSSFTVIGPGTRRGPWSHYLARPGRIETIGGMDASDIGEGFVTGRSDAATLDIGAISRRALETAQQWPELDRKSPIRTSRTTLRWVVAQPPTVEGPRGTFVVESPTLRTLSLELPEGDLLDAVQLSEDLALHDWLLTVVTGLFGRLTEARQPIDDRVNRLRPVGEQLLHLWMPGARVSDDLLPVWAHFEERPGFSRQWNVLAGWIRDQISIGMLAALQAKLGAANDR